MGRWKAGEFREDEVTLRIRLTEGQRYPVWTGCDAPTGLARAWQPQWRWAALIGDAKVLALHGAAVARELTHLAAVVVVSEFPAGERHKTRETKARLEDELLEAGLSREGCVVALGGGVTLDLAGFVAATFMRGVPWIGVPTSLLAQVDAAVGGKTAVNTPRGKNLIGAFHQPSAVIIDPGYLATLPREEWGNGLAEVVKHAVIADAELFAWIEREADELARCAPLSAAMLRRCVEIKANIVAEDPLEQGRRAVLNFGHTVGHAIEAACHTVEATCRGAGGHGRAVASGMRVEARVAEQLVGFPAAERDRLEALLAAFELGASPGIDLGAVEPFLEVDKKRGGGAQRMALPERIGAMARAGELHTVEVPREVLRRAWEETWAG